MGKYKSFGEVGILCPYCDSEKTYVTIPEPFFNLSESETKKSLVLFCSNCFNMDEG